MAIKFHCVEIEIHDDALGEDGFIGTLKAFDECAYEIKIERKILSGEDLMAIAKKLTWLEDNEGWI